jgi:hypothetical protein
LAIAATAVACGPASGAAIPLPAEAAEVARDFLFAFSRNDRAAIKRMLPRTLSGLYGPCPFAKMPSLEKPRADGRVGALDFEVQSLDPELPRRGIIVLRLVEEENRRSWRVRQMYWFDELPPEADIPDRSPTSSDRRQEPAIRQAVLEFLRAWLRSDFERMDQLTFHWWEVPRRPPRWVKMTGLDLEGHPTTLNGIRVDFTARLRFAGVLSKHIRGNVWLTREDGCWRARPITFSLLF